MVPSTRCSSVSECGQEMGIGAAALKKSMTYAWANEIWTWIYLGLVAGVAGIGTSRSGGKVAGEVKGEGR